MIYDLAKYIPSPNTSAHCKKGLGSETKRDMIHNEMKILYTLLQTTTLLLSVYRKLFRMTCKNVMWYPSSGERERQSDGQNTIPRYPNAPAIALEDPNRPALLGFSRRPSSVRMIFDESFSCSSPTITTGTFLYSENLSSFLNRGLTSTIVYGTAHDQTSLTK